MDASVGSLLCPRQDWREKVGAYTHLRNSSTLLVRDWWRQDRDHHVISVRWPGHRTGGGIDPRLLAQTVRQCGLLVAHAEFEVPLEHHTLLHHLTLTTTDPGFRAGDGADLEVGLSVTQEARRSSVLNMVFHIRHRGITVAVADTAFAWVSPAVYRRMRGPRAVVDWAGWDVPPPVAPHLVGRAHTGEVLLSSDGSGHRWQLRNDVTSVLLYDHPVDHVPGLVLLEAAQQAAQAFAHPLPVEFTDVSIDFTSYVEFDAPCWIEAVLQPVPLPVPLPAPLPDRHSLLITGRQNGRTVFQARLKGFRPAP